tara:strand:- start:3130 stop:3384 length:255 start_codon:yes stop_codon:yes gene_type:complete
MKKFIDTVKEKIKKNINVNKIEIIDNTFMHRQHKQHVKNKFHLKIIIESDFLQSMSKIESQRKIMNILDKEIKEKIHSLEIKIN